MIPAESGKHVKSIATTILIATGLALLSPREAKAWSRDGHRIICRIAWQLLDPPQRAEIERLTSLYRNPDGEAVGSYYDACSFADQARGRARSTPSWSRFAVFEPWHFLNVPRTTVRLPEPPCATGCVVAATHAHSDSLRHASTDESRAEALLFLSHWISDMHQPLHVGYLDDAGGNGVRPIEGGYYRENNLHSLWDGGLLFKLVGSTNWEDFADRLARIITPAQRSAWATTSPRDWAQESYDLITSPAAQYCDWQGDGEGRACVAKPGGRTLGEAYQAEFADDVVLRLQQAGVRLAETLRRNLPVR